MLSLEDLRVEDVMTPVPLTLAEDASVADAVRLLIDRRLSGAPVVGRDGALLSVLSASDLLRILDELIPEQEEELPRAANVAALRSRTVGSLASRAALTCEASTPVAEACKAMVRNRVHRLVVVRGREPIGIVTAIDAVRAVACLDDLTPAQEDLRAPQERRHP